MPYIGATLVTLPVVVVAYFQFGVTPDFYWVIGAYLVIQVLDGNVLVPLLFSEAVDLHPVAIVIAVLFFGGIWGCGASFLLFLLQRWSTPCCLRGPRGMPCPPPSVAYHLADEAL